MHSALALRRKGLWPQSLAEASVTLDFEARQRRHATLTTDHGEQILLDLPHAEIMAEGDGLRLGDGRWVLVRAAAEPLVEVRHPDPRQLVRLAWHLGNRHVPAEVWPGSLRVRPEPAVEDMLVRAGAQLTKSEAPFHPEPGVHEHPGGHGHPHNHGNGR
jgi:urease accessory protein